MSALTACQCRRGTPACKRLTTQEDLRCDVCRGGCTQLGWGPVGTAPERLEMASHWETPETTWGEPIIIDDPIRDHTESATSSKAVRDWFASSGIRSITSVWPPEIDSAPPATREHAGTPPNPPSTRTRPHMSGTDPTRNPRNPEAT